MKNLPNTTLFDRVVVRPIANGYLVEFDTESEEITHCFQNYKQVLKFLRTLETVKTEGNTLRIPG